MKRCLLLLPLLLAYMLSCVGTPKPNSADDCLVVGSIVMNYPNGFFNQRYIKKIDTKIAVMVTNVTKGSTFTVLTAKDGYFHFLSNGYDFYKLEYVMYKDSNSDSRYTSYGGLGVNFSAKPHTVQYIGHFSLTFSLGEEGIKKVDTHSKQGSLYDYKQETKHDIKTDEVKSYLANLDPNSPWLSDYEIIPVTFTK